MAHVDSMMLYYSKRFRREVIRNELSHNRTNSCCNQQTTLVYIPADTGRLLTTTKTVLVQFSPHSPLGVDIATVGTIVDQSLFLRPENRNICATLILYRYVLFTHLKPCFSFVHKCLSLVSGKALNTF